MGNALQDQGKLDEAIEAFNKAPPSSLIILEPITTWAMLSKGKLDEAIEANKALSAKPDFTEAYYNIGNAPKSKVSSEAIEAFNKALPSSLIILKPLLTWAMLSKIKIS